MGLKRFINFLTSPVDCLVVQEVKRATRGSVTRTVLTINLEMASIEPLTDVETVSAAQSVCMSLTGAV